MDFYQWPSIEQFRNFYADLQRLYPWDKMPKVQINYKPKLHGTNAAIACDSQGQITFQSRNRIITVEDDNAGFARWGSNNARKIISPDKSNFILYGEWIGKGIVSGNTACQQAERDFYIFAVLDLNTSKVISSPDEITKFVQPDMQNHVIPFVFSQEIDFSSSDSVNAGVDEINAYITKLEENDPFLEEKLGIAAPGEGLVGYVLLNDSFHLFKVKTIAHSTEKSNKQVTVKAPSLQNVQEFVSTYVTEARLQQGVDTLGLSDRDPKKTGPFIQWLVADVQKETVDVIQEQGIKWQNCVGPISSVAREWYLGKKK